MADGEGISLISSPGARLAVARKQAGLSASEVAERLHLNPQVLEALEEGRLECLGAVVYARGHLKRYAELVAVPEAEILAGYDAWSGKPASQPDLRDVITAPAVRSGTRRFALKPWHALSGAIVLVLVMVVWWAMRKQTHVVAAVTAPATTQAAVVDPGMPPAATSAAVSAPVAAPPAQVKSAPVPVPAPVPGPASATASTGATAVHLRLSFSQSSWITIDAADGSKLFHGMAPAGSHRDVTGNAPLRVFLGNPPGVSLEMNGRPVVMTGIPRPRRFTLDDAGHIVEAPAADASDKGSAAQPRSD
jgi:cytoskeleton protein RodZ